MDYIKLLNISYIFKKPNLHKFSVLSTSTPQIKVSTKEPTISTGADSNGYL